MRSRVVRVSPLATHRRRRPRVLKVSFLVLPRTGSPGQLEPYGKAIESSHTMVPSLKRMLNAAVQPPPNEVDWNGLGGRGDRTSRPERLSAPCQRFEGATSVRSWKVNSVASTNLSTALPL